MDVAIKCDYDLEGSDTLSCASNEDELSGQNSVIESSTFTEQKVLYENDKKCTTVPEKTGSGNELSLRTKKLLLKYFKQFDAQRKRWKILLQLIP
ncbi:hypothetical protein EVAR_69107_1 [Eumeta japonica]|uniref:Uncharacterized protein n=1 Tax=Eumeta variegata TaxID=151549 RepID=A0A4C1SDA2_EUMVA|nr:hypothetical protein EVAR_69107_1 [Eumeta japonica]